LSVQTFLSRLQKVRKTGAGRWIACCPAHEDYYPSLKVKEGQEGPVLVICRAGCDNNAIREAVGMEWRDFFPERSTGVYDRKLRSAFPLEDVLTALASETLLVSVAACNVANGIELTAEDKARLLAAYERIESARSMASG
jgi:hypothetical protein